MKVALLGDIAFIGNMSIKTNPNISNCFAEVAEYLSQFDYVIGNLETPFSKLKKVNGAKSAYICADIENVQILKQLHVKAVCLANNHMFDFGEEGYETTKKVLLNNNIEFFGTEGRKVFYEKDGTKIAISGFCCYTSNPLCCVRGEKYGVNAYNIEDVHTTIKKNLENGYMNIVSIHSGLEHVNYPSLHHVRAARFLANDFQYVYYGHHPHVIQGIEEYNGSVIAHSLGNFCFDDVYIDHSSIPLVTMNENNRNGAILELEINDNNVIEWREQIIYISKKGNIKLIDQLPDIEKYNNCLISCEKNEKDYTNKRNAILKSRITERKATRNLMWYLKRLRPRYIQILLNARRNNQEFKNNVLKYISNESRNLQKF